MHQNYDLYEIRHNVMALLARAQLTPATAYFLIKDVAAELEKMYIEQVNIEAEKIKEEEQKEIEKHPDDSVEIVLSSEDLDKEAITNE